jgi:nitrosocyanin
VSSATARRLGLLAAALGAALELGAQPGAVEMVVSRSGFNPRVLELRKGDAVSLRLRSEDTEHCFAIDAFRVEKRVVPGRTTTAEFTADQAGEFPFYCCLEPDNKALRGRLIVRD